MTLDAISAWNTTLSDDVSPKVMMPSVPAANVTIPTKYESPVTDNPPPTVTLPSMPIPPSTKIAPVFGSPRVLSNPFVNDVIPVTFKLV